jgi:zinc transport system substrate-binding protein
MSRLLVALLTLAVLAGCGARASGYTAGKLDVVTAFYPLQFISQRIGGDAVTVSNLTKPGAEPHDIELNPRQVGQVADAGLAVYLSGFQPAVDDAVEQEARGRSFDVGTVAGLLPLAGGKQKDPHVWLDPLRLAAIADRLGERLGRGAAHRARRIECRIPERAGHLPAA